MKSKEPGATEKDVSLYLQLDEGRRCGERVRIFVESGPRGVEGRVINVVVEKQTGGDYGG